MTVRLDRHGDVALITMDDGKANAAGIALLTSLAGALDEAEQGAGAVVLAGRPGVFCAGFDLKVLQQGTAEDAGEMVRRGAEVAVGLFGCPRPTIVACTGHAIALGAVLLLCGDTRIGEDGDYRFTLNETAMGLPLPPFAAHIPRARLSPTDLMAFAVQSQAVDVAGALSAGVLGKVVEHGTAVEAALEVAEQLAKLPPEAYAANKQAILRPTLDLLRDG